MHAGFGVGVARGHFEVDGDGEHELGWLVVSFASEKRGEESYRKLRSELEPRDGERKHCISAREYLEGEDGLFGLSFDNDEEVEENSSQSEKCQDRWMGPWECDATQLDGN